MTIDATLFLERPLFHGISHPEVLFSQPNHVHSGHAHSFPQTIVVSWFTVSLLCHGSPCPCCVMLRSVFAVLCTFACVTVCCSVLRCVAVCCGVLQRVAVCCSVLQCVALSLLRHAHCFASRCVTVCCSVRLCAALCCSVLQCVTVCYSVLQCVTMSCGVLHYVAVCYSVLQCVAVCCSVLKCDAA